MSGTASMGRRTADQRPTPTRTAISRTTTVPRRSESSTRAESILGARLLLIVGHGAATFAAFHRAEFDQPKCLGGMSDNHVSLVNSLFDLDPVAENAAEFH